MHFPGIVVYYNREGQKAHRIKEDKTMTMIKNLSKNVVKQNPNFTLREDLNFSDDGNRFRGFDYKGLPITTLRADDITYLTIRVDYLYNQNSFTYSEWMETEEYNLCDEFNGVSEVDLDKLIENCERVLAKMAEMNKAAEAEDVDMSDVKASVDSYIARGTAAIEKVRNIDWLDLEAWQLRSIKEMVKSLRRTMEDLASKDFDSMCRRDKAEWKKRRTGYAEWYIEELEKYCK